MATSGLWYSLVLALLIALSSQQQNNPLDNFCRRFGHQATVIDDRMYIDGGWVNRSPFEQDNRNYSNKYLTYGDFKIDNQGMPQQFANLSKGVEVPSVQGGILWPDPVNKFFYLYGGEYMDGAPEPLSVWAYDIIANKWISKTVQNLQIQRTSYGAGTTDEGRGIGYYYGGWLSNASVPGFGDRIPTNGLLTYDLVNDKWANTTGPPDQIPRAEGVLLFIPASDGGMLVHFGGIQFPSYASGNYTPAGVPMNEIRLYDIANDKWYTQNATGDVPEMRSRFCAGVTWAEDQSSYNIYLYGGAGMPPNTVGFDDVYILSLPAFTWIKWYPENPGTGYPHHSLSCNVVKGSQMIIMGGTFPNSTQCDVPKIYGQHNLNLGKTNPDGEKWYKFLPNVTKYEVPSEIIAQIGGGAQGGATKRAPDGGWGDRDLETYFSRRYTAAARNPTRSIPNATATAAPKNTPKPKPFPAGAVAGGAVCGFIILVAFATLIFLCLRRSRQSHNSPQAPVELDSANVSPPQVLGVPQQTKSIVELHTEPKTPIAELGPSPNSPAAYQQFHFPQPVKPGAGEYSPGLQAYSVPLPESPVNSLRRQTRVGSGASYAITPQGSPPLAQTGFDSPSSISSPYSPPAPQTPRSVDGSMGSPPIPQPYYADARASGIGGHAVEQGQMLGQVQQELQQSLQHPGYGFPYSPQQAQQHQSWTSAGSQSQNQIYYPPPSSPGVRAGTTAQPSEMPTARSSPAHAGYQDTIYPVPEDTVPRFRGMHGRSASHNIAPSPDGSGQGVGVEQRASLRHGRSFSDGNEGDGRDGFVVLR